MRRFLGIFMIVVGFAAFFVFETQNQGVLSKISAQLQGKDIQSAPDASQQGALSGPARVIDGDTLEISGERIRLHGIDAPEQGQTCATPSGKRWTCGRVATAQLIEHLQGKSVACGGIERDRYGRLIAICHVAGEDIGAWMVRGGWAFAYRRYSGNYIAEEADARRRGLGIWTGAVQPPWEWRQQSQ